MITERAASKSVIDGFIHLRTFLRIWAINLGQNILWTAKTMTAIMNPEIADGLHGVNRLRIREGNKLKRIKLMWGDASRGPLKYDGPQLF